MDKSLCGVGKTIPLFLLYFRATFIRDGSTKVKKHGSCLIALVLLLYAFTYF